MAWNGTAANQRGEYGSHTSTLLSSVRSGEVPIETKRDFVSPVIIGAGLLVGVVGWPMYRKNTPLGVIALGVSSSMVSTGLIRLLLGRTDVF